MRRFVAFFLLVLTLTAAAVLIAVAVALWSTKPSEVAQTTLRQDVKICVTPVESAMEIPWSLYLVNESTDDLGPFGVNPSAEGVGMLCGTLAVLPGDIIKLNGMFVDESQQMTWWLYMSDTRLDGTVTVNGVAMYPNVVRWEHGADGEFTVQ